MAISLAADQPAAAVRSAFNEYRRHAMPGLPLPPHFRLSPGVQVWTADFEAALNGRVLETARQAGWRYFAFDQATAIAGDMVLQDNRFVLTRIFGGDRVMETMDALAYAEDVTQGQNIAARILSLSSIFVVAIWLVFEEPRFIEVRTTPQNLLFSRAEFLDRLQRRAVDRLGREGQ